LCEGDELEKPKRGGIRKGAGRIPLDDSKKKKGVKIYITDYVKEDILEYGVGKNFSDKVAEIVKSELDNRKR